MNTARVALAVARKELRTGVRDRQSLVYTMLLPLALYPVLFWLMVQGFLVVQGQRERTRVAVSVAGDLEAGEEARLESALARPEPGPKPGPVELRFAPGAGGAAGPIEALRAGALDLEVGLGAAQDGSAELRFDGSKSRSTLARDRVAERLKLLAEDARTEAVGGDAGALQAFSVERVSLASEREETAYMLSFLLPMMFTIMAVLGAFFPALDATAGEKERRTAETTLLLPVPRTGVLLGKVLAVSVFATAAATLNVGGLLAAAESLLAGLGVGQDEFQVPWSRFPPALPLLLVFLVTTSALMVAIGSFAETFKQGQALLGPVQMVVLLPAILVSMPGIELTPVLAVVPVAQTALAFKAILQGDARALELGLVVVSQLVYAALALGLALRLGSHEALLFGGGGKGRARLRALLRAGSAPR